MFIRTISAICALLIFLPAFIWSDTVIFIIAVAFLSTMSVFEMLRCTGYLKKPAISIPAFILAVFVPIISRFDNIFGVDYFSGRVFITLFASSLVFFFAAITYLILSNKENDMHSAISTVAICIYIIGGYTSLILLRDLEHGEYLYLMPFLTAWGSDIFAYLVGRFFGKHKLAPRVSPKKTVEGSIGGIIGNIIFYAVYAVVLSAVVSVQPNYIALILIAIVTSVISQIGDLFMSLIKRHHGIKDFGKIMPGHGGVLDRFDSFIATASFLYLLCKVSTFFRIF